MWPSQRTILKIDSTNGVLRARGLPSNPGSGPQIGSHHCHGQVAFVANDQRPTQSGLSKIEIPLKRVHATMLRQRLAHERPEDPATQRALKTRRSGSEVSHTGTMPTDFSRYVGD